MTSRKIYSPLLAFGVTLAMVVSMSGWTERTVAVPAASDAALMALPASDAVMFVDVQRLMTELLPRILVNNPALLARMNADVALLKESTGVDVRSFEQIAIGARFDSAPGTANQVEDAANAANDNSQPHGRKGSAGAPTINAVAIVRGRFDASAVAAILLSKAKAKNSSQSQEQTYGGKTIYTEGAAKNRMALTVLDANTIAVGNLESVRQTIDANAGGARVDEALVTLAKRNASALFGFGSNVPASLLQRFGTGADEWSQAFASVRQLYGSFSATESNGEMLISLLTENADQARVVGEKLVTLKQLMGSFHPQAAPTGGAPKGTLGAEPRTARNGEAQPSTGTSILLPSLGLVVGTGAMNWIHNMNIVTDGNEVRVKFEQKLNEILPPVNGSHYAK